LQGLSHHNFSHFQPTPVSFHRFAYALFRKFQLFPFSIELETNWKPTDRFGHMMSAVARAMSEINGLEEELWTEYELAARWRVPVSFLRRRRAQKLPPEFLKLGPHVRYPRSSVDKFAIESRRNVVGE
jgi:hypothetical protein